MPDNLDDIARQVTPQADQQHAGVRTFAGLVAVYYRTLREQGIGVESATYLTRDYQSIHLHHSLGRGHDG